MIEYLKSASPVYPGLDGRIQFLGHSDVCRGPSSAAAAPGSRSLALLLLVLVFGWVVRLVRLGQ